MILGWFLFTRRRDPLGRVLLGLLIVGVVATLGPHLHVASRPQLVGGALAYRPSIPMPWLPFTHLPAFKEISPERIEMYVSLVAAVAAAMWLAAGGRRAWWRWLVAAAAIALLLPNLSLPFWHERFDDPRFFTTNAYRSYLTPGERVLIFPFGVNGNSMLWQAQDDFRFQMTEGYVGIATPPSYFAEPIGRYMEYGPRFQVPLARIGPDLRAFIRQRDVGAIIIDTTSGSPWSLLVPATLHLRPTSVDGVSVYQIPASWRANQA